MEFDLSVAIQWELLFAQTGAHKAGDDFNARL
jgi:hypothetical protein